MVRELKISEIDAFIDFGDRLYADDPKYVPFIRRDFKKTIRRLVFEEKTYKALISVDESGRLLGRILLTTGKNKQLKTGHCGYFSHLEVVLDFEVFAELMRCSEQTVAAMGAEFLLGSFFPDDPDNRRGILVRGYEYPPMIFTSHNLPYYGEFFESAGYSKLTDALEYDFKPDPERMERIHKVASRIPERANVHASRIDFDHIDREIRDIHEIMVRASTEINFEEVPDIEELRKIFEGWRLFIDPDFGVIVRRNEDERPVGFLFSIPDYNELIRRMKGRLNLRALLIFATQRRKISGLRSMLQYVVPEYQRRGVLTVLYSEMKKAIDAHQISRVSLGTIMENNISSNSATVSAGGELSRVYRLYYKRLDGGI